MPIIRNPFRKQDENVRPASTTTLNGVEQKGGANASAKAIDIQEKEPPEYKLSEINDSGVYLPPSPPERKQPFWPTASSRSTTNSSNHRSVFNENEQFNISRESFDSYRRSFDISARSPIIPAYDTSSRPPRASLDSRTFQPAPRSSNSFHRPLQVPAQTQEEVHDTFEDVDIGASAAESAKPQPTKKRGLFSRITDSGDHSERPGSSGDGQQQKSSSWHHFGGRKRGQSGQGSELGSIPKRETTPRPESQAKKEHVAQLQQQQQQPKVQVNGVDTTPQKVQGPEVPKVKEPQAEAGTINIPGVQDGIKQQQQAKAGVEMPKADSGVDMQPVEDGMTDIQLDEPNVERVAAADSTTTVAPKTQNIPTTAPKPADAQAPVVAGAQQQKAQGDS